MGQGIEKAKFIFKLAYLLQYIADYQKAEKLYEQSLEIYKQELGENHLDTVTNYNNLGGVYARQGKYKEAESLYKKGLEIREKILEENHPDTATSYNNLAYVYASQGKYKIALVYYLKAYKILIFKLGLQHPNTQIVYKNMEIAYSEWNPEGNFNQWLEEMKKIKQE